VNGIVGYTYAADTYCTGECVTDAMEVASSPDPTECVLDQVAQERGIDRMDERSFDSDHFPKVVFGKSVDEPEQCGGCGVEIG
jgi:hypothetical protein